jgi:hypothetical protein
MENLHEEKAELARDILRSFHTQFAENQRIREQAFLKILGFLGAVIFGYAYVFENYWDDVEKYSLVTTASEIILLFGSLIISTIAYNFRRDQYINAKIRRSCDILGEGKIFPEGYDPSVSLKNIRRIFSWMPDFLAVFFWLFPLFQFILYKMYASNLANNFPAYNKDDYPILTLYTFLSCIIINIGANFLYYIKLRKKIGISKKRKK